MKAATLLLVALFAATADAKCYGGAFFGAFRGTWYDSVAGDSAIIMVPENGLRVKIDYFRTGTTNANKYFFVGRAGTKTGAKTVLDSRGTGGAAAPALAASHADAVNAALYSIAYTTEIDQNTASSFTIDLGDDAKTDYSADGGADNKALKPAKATDCLWLALHSADGAGTGQWQGFFEFKHFLRGGPFMKVGALYSAAGDVDITDSAATLFTVTGGAHTTTANVRLFVGESSWEQSITYLIALGSSDQNKAKGISRVGGDTDVDTNALNAGAGHTFPDSKTAENFKWLALYEGGSTQATKRVITYLKNCD